MKVVLHMSGFTPEQMGLIQKAADILEQVMAKPEFTEGVMATGEQKLIDALIHGTQVTLNLQFYKPWNPFTKAVAATYGGVIHLNPRAFIFGMPFLTGNLAHEFIHTLGYDHVSNYASIARAKGDLTYKIGDLVEKMAGAGK